MNAGDQAFRAIGYGGGDPFAYIEPVVVVESLGDYGSLIDVGGGKKELVKSDSIFATREAAVGHLRSQLTTWLMDELFTVSAKYKEKLERISA